MKVRPITRNAATAWIAKTHRHLRRSVTGWLFGVEILDDRDHARCYRAGSLQRV